LATTAADKPKLERTGQHIYYTCMLKKLTITIDEEVYQGLHRVVGKRRISRFLNDLARPFVVDEGLEEGYRAMAADEAHESEAVEWIEGVVGDVAA
jgi:hypothetical protein